MLLESSPHPERSRRIRGPIRLPTRLVNLSDVLRQPQRVVDRGVNVARGDGVADAVERIEPCGIADDSLRTAGDEGGVIDLAAIARSRLQPEVELVERQGAVLDDDLV